MYPTHIATTAVQKILLGVGSAAVSILRPDRGDMIATFGEVTAPLVLPSIQRIMETYAEGREILTLRPHVRNSTIDVAKLRAMPARTLGREYVRFLDNLSTSPDARPPVQFVDDPQLAYVMERYRETHDFYHVVLEMPTSMLGEVTVKWWEGLQLGLPMCVLGGLFGASRLYPKQREKYLREYLPWVVKTAPDARFFMSVFWERRFEQTVEELRREMGIDKEPPSVKAASG